MSDIKDKISTPHKSNNKSTSKKVAKNITLKESTKSKTNSSNKNNLSQKEIAKSSSKKTSGPSKSTNIKKPKNIVNKTKKNPNTKKVEESSNNHKGNSKYDNALSDKKAIFILLLATIIILILVVTASYAYFSIQSVSNETTRNVTTKTPKIGSVVLSNPTTSLHIRLNALNMKEEDASSKLYATDTEEDYESVKTPRIIGKATINGGETYTKYKCTYDLKINITGTMKNSLQEGDAKLIFSGALTGEYDLVGIVTPKKIEFNNLSGTNREETLYVVLEFNNKNVKQDHLQGKSLNIELINENLACNQVVS